MKIKIFMTTLAILCTPLTANDSEEIARIYTQNSHDDQFSPTAVVKSFLEAFAEDNPEKLSSLMSSSVKVEDATTITGSSFSKHAEMSRNLLVRMRALHKSFPDMKVNLVNMFAEGNQVFARIGISGTQQGTFFGIAPTNKPVFMRAFSVFTVSQGKIVAVSEMWNEFTVLKQIGYIPI